LYYRQCGNEVKLGDSIKYKPICRHEIPGMVIYLPGISPVHPRFERQGFRQWAIQLENGWILAWLFAPSELQPSRRLRFVRRALDGFKGLDPAAELL
jgi:hypothetical protein